MIPTAAHADAVVIYSARILTAIDSGLSIRDAFDSVMGEGAYAALAGEVYDALRPV